MGAKTVSCSAQYNFLVQWLTIPTVFHLMLSRHIRNLL